MSIETQLYTALSALCPRVFPDFAPVTTARPYVTYQFIGGKSIRFLDNTTGNKRNSRVQINVWAGTRLEAMTLSRSIEDALCASTVFTAQPEAEPIGDFDADIPVYGAIQDFLIHSTR